MTLLGYVSDERYLALPDVAVEISARDSHWTARSIATGAIHADLPPGRSRRHIRHGHGPIRSQRRELHRVLPPVEVDALDSGCR